MPPYTEKERACAVLYLEDDVGLLTISVCVWAGLEVKENGLPDCNHLDLSALSSVGDITIDSVKDHINKWALYLPLPYHIFYLKLDFSKNCRTNMFAINYSVWKITRDESILDIGIELHMPNVDPDTR